MDSNSSSCTSSSITWCVSAIDVDLAMSSDVSGLYKHTSPTTSPTVIASTLSFRRYEAVEMNKFTDLPP